LDPLRRVGGSDLGFIIWCLLFGVGFGSERSDLEFFIWNFLFGIYYLGFIVWCRVWIRSEESEVRIWNFLFGIFYLVWVGCEGTFWGSK
jgi:hypothetical protein